jgi:hypothetical protein
MREEKRAIRLSIYCFQLVGIEIMLEKATASMLLFFLDSSGSVWSVGRSASEKPNSRITPEMSGGNGHFYRIHAGSTGRSKP